MSVKSLNRQIAPLGVSGAVADRRHRDAEMGDAVVERGDADGAPANRLAVSRHSSMTFASSGP